MLPKIDYKGNGIRKEYKIPFKYDGSDLFVYVDNEQVSFKIIKNDTIQLDIIPDEGTTVSIRRKTNIDDIYSMWVNGEQFEADKQNSIQLQLIKALQEINEQEIDSLDSILNGDMYVKLDMNGYLINNLDDPQELTDLVPKQFFIDLLPDTLPVAEYPEVGIKVNDTFLSSRQDQGDELVGGVQKYLPRDVEQMVLVSDYPELESVYGSAGGIITLPANIAPSEGLVDPIATDILPASSFALYQNDYTSSFKNTAFNVKRNETISLHRHTSYVDLVAYSNTGVPRLIRREQDATYLNNFTLFAVKEDYAFLSYAGSTHNPKIIKIHLDTGSKTDTVFDKTFRIPSYVSPTMITNSDILYQNDGRIIIGGVQNISGINGVSNHELILYSNNFGSTWNIYDTGFYYSYINTSNSHFNYDTGVFYSTVRIGNNSYIVSTNNFTTWTTIAQNNEAPVTNNSKIINVSGLNPYTGYMIEKNTLNDSTFHLNIKKDYGATLVQKITSFPSGYILNPSVTTYSLGYHYGNTFSFDTFNPSTNTKYLNLITNMDSLTYSNNTPVIGVNSTGLNGGNFNQNKIFESISNNELTFFNLEEIMAGNTTHKYYTRGK